MLKNSYVILDLFKDKVEILDTKSANDIYYNININLRHHFALIHIILQNFIQTFQ